MNIKKAINRLIKTDKCEKLDIDYNYVFLSDMHLGSGNNADETVTTEHVIKYVLNDYLQKGYRVVLLGDTFELAETHDIEKIKNAHPEIMDILRKLHEQGRLFIVKGNHDMYLNEEDLYSRTDTNGSRVFFLDGIQLLQMVQIGEVYALHGHQNKWIFSSWFNHILLALGVIWRGWQMHHSDFHTKESSGWQARAKFDKQWMDFAEKENKFVIVGHSHEPKMFHNYANCGTSGVMRRHITATELTRGASLVRNVDFKEIADTDGFIKIQKEVTNTTIVQG